MIGLETLTVSIQFGEKEIQVGELILNNRKIYFKYHLDFLVLGIELSPFKLPLKEGILEADQIPFDGLHGVFADSLPDGWGRLLLDRKLASKGINFRQVSPLDRLAYVGTSALGALIYRPKYEIESDFKNEIDLDQLYTEMNLVLEGTSSDIIDELFTIGGSPGGARPKIVVGYNPKTDHLIYGADTLPKGYEDWIIKFPSETDLPDIAQIEYAYSEMAKDAGLEMEVCKLFKGKTNQLFFGTKRFDRKNGKRLHLHSAAGLLNDNFRYSNLDYGNIMDAAFQLEKDVESYRKVLRLAAFNIFTHNRDDHSKNFAFLMDEKGKWRFSPVYDLTFSASSHGMHSTMVAGESKAPNVKHLLELANVFSVDKPLEIIEEVKNVVSQWEKYAKQCGVTKNSTRIINRVLKVSGRE